MRGTPYGATVLAMAEPEPIVPLLRLRLVFPAAMSVRELARATKLTRREIRRLCEHLETTGEAIRVGKGWAATRGRQNYAVGGGLFPEDVEAWNRAEGIE